MLPRGGEYQAGWELERDASNARRQVLLGRADGGYEEAVVPPPNIYEAANLAPTGMYDAPELMPARIYDEPELMRADS